MNPQETEEALEEGHTGPTQAELEPDNSATQAEPAYWFVCQGQTLNQNQGMKYLWAPQEGKTGSIRQYWESMKDVKPGDIIFNYADKAFRGVSVANEYARAAANPKPSNEWSGTGMMFDISFSPLSPPVLYDHESGMGRRLQEATRGIKGPFDVNGKVKQGYLFEFNKEAAAIVQEAYGRDLPLETKPIAQHPPAFDPEIMHSLNTILYGPPGTGKTFRSIELAVEIATGVSQGTHADRKRVFDELRESGQVEFVTFHQNYTYEDFIIGIRPDVEETNLRFAERAGIFYDIVERARENFEAVGKKQGLPKSFDEAFEKLIEPLGRGEEKEVQMASGISFYIFNVNDKTIFFRKHGGGTDNTLKIATLKKIADGIRDAPVGLASYYLPLVDIIRGYRAPSLPAADLKRFVLVIDEINRANISRVFGELITLLETDKRMGEENELKVTLPNGEKDFAVPPNLYIVGTMNTADKSIALIDVALRRRFEFVGYYPDDGLLGGEAAQLLRKINSAIFDQKKSADYLIGHAYFMNYDRLEEVLRNKVIPLLMEYFSSRIEAVENIFRGTGWRVSYDSTKWAWIIEAE